MANPHPKPNPRTAIYPWLKCVNCKKTKRATRFPKRGGLSYEKLKATDPKRYDSQCKLCKKPALPGQKRKDVAEPKTAGMGRPKKRATRSDWSGLSPKDLKQRTRIETRIKSMLYQSEKGCCECGERDPRKLQYDHKNPADKHRGISRLIVDGYSWSSSILRAEIRKCRILCANCHAVHTIKQQGYYAHAPVRRTLKSIAAEYGFEI